MNKAYLFSILSGLVLISCSGANNANLPDRDKVPPTVLISPNSTSANQIFPVSTVISATFNEDMDVQSVEDGFIVKPNNNGSVKYDPDTKTVIYSPDPNIAGTLLQGDTVYTVTLKNTIKDRAKNALVQNVVWSFTTEDNVKPIINTFFPNKNAINIGLQENIILSFSEKINKESFAANFSLKVDNADKTAKIPVIGEPSVIGNEATFNPTELLKPNTKYYVTISTGVSDLNNNRMKEIVTYTFETGIDNSRPTFKIISPLDGSQNISTKVTIDIEFSKQMFLDSFTANNFRLERLNSVDSSYIATPVSGTFSQKLSTNNKYIVSFKPEKLSLLNKYSITLTTGLLDESKNKLIVGSNIPSSFRVKDGIWSKAAFPIQKIDTKIIAPYNIQSVSDDKGNILVVWIEKDTLTPAVPGVPAGTEPFTEIQSRQYLNDGSGWQPTKFVASVNVPYLLNSTLRLKMDRDGNAIITWLQTNPNNDAEFELKAHRYIAGKWLTTPPEILAFGTYRNLPNHELDMLPDGNAISVWDLDIGNGNNTQILSKRFIANNGIVNGVWSTAIENVMQNNPDLSLPLTYLSHLGSVNLKNDGSAHVIYISHYTGSLLYALWSAQSPFATSTPSRIDSLEDNRIVSIYSSHNDNGVMNVTWGVDNNTVNEIWANHYDIVNGWTGAQQINKYIVSNGYIPNHKTISYSNGDAVAIVNQDKTSYSSLYSNLMRWKNNPSIIGLGLINSHSSLYVDQNNIAISGWTNSTGVMYNRYIPDNKSWSAEQPLFTTNAIIPTGFILFASQPDGTTFAIWIEKGSKVNGIDPTYIYANTLTD